MRTHGCSSDGESSAAAHKVVLSVVFAAAEKGLRAAEFLHGDLRAGGKLHLSAEVAAGSAGISPHPGRTGLERWTGTTLSAVRSGWRVHWGLAMPKGVLWKPGHDKSSQSRGLLGKEERLHLEPPDPRNSWGGWECLEDGLRRVELGFWS